MCRVRSKADTTNRLWDQNRTNQTGYGTDLVLPPGAGVRDPLPEEAQGLRRHQLVHAHYDALWYMAEVNF